MLRFHTALTSLLAAVLVPAVFLGDGEIGSLEQALGETERALQVLGSVLKNAEGGDASAVGAVRRATESPILDPERRDARLVDLRNQVNLLQAELDGLRAPALGTVAPPPPAEAAALPPITSGLSPHVLEGLVARPTLEPAPATGAPASAAPPAATGAPLYSADPVGHARACYLAGHFQKCLELTQQRADDPEALFWKARALERLGRLDEAVATMREAATRGEGTPLAQRARTEIEFLEWRRSFLADAPGRTGETP